MTAEPDRYPPELAVGVTSTRLATVSPAARAVHRVILRAFAATGQPPDRRSLAGATADGLDVATLLAELHYRDVIRLDKHARVRAAYPFSAAPTAHVVAIADGPTVHAMCAIDALGIAEMLGAGTTITSVDPASGGPVRVRVHNGQAVWEPDTAVVVVGSITSAGADGCQPDGDVECVAPAADRCCGVMNFFATATGAQQWLAARPDVSGIVLSKDQALRLGVDIFGSLLND